MRLITLILFTLIIMATTAPPARAEDSTSAPKPTKFDSHLDWWREARYGMFIHWGPVTLTGGEISWSRAKSNPNSPNEGATPVDVYDNLYKKFNPTKFNAREWVDIAKRSGFKYMVLTVKHCDGFLLWNSKTIDYNIMNTPFGRDVVAELTKAAREADMPFCIYFAPGDWKDPDCRHPEFNPRFVERMHAQLTELLTHYGKIPLIWFDYDGYPNPSEPRETATLVRKLMPGVIITNRLEPLHSDESHGLVTQWGDYATPEQFVGSYCDQVPWETCMTMGTQWSFKPNDQLKSTQKCVEILVRSVGGDGNLLFNTGPMATGEIEPRQAERLLEIGDWLRKNAESIYATRGGPYPSTAQYASTRTDKAIYIHALAGARQELVLPALPLAVQSAALIDGTPVKFSQSDQALTITLPSQRDPYDTVIRLTVKGSILDLPAIFPPSKTRSLAYRKPATVSSSIAPSFMHDAGAALDDNDGTFWSTGRSEKADGVAGHRFEHFQFLPNSEIWQHSGWLAVDLGASKTVKRAIIKEKIQPRFYAPVSSWKIEYLAGDNWTIAAEGTAIGKELEVAFPNPVAAARFRLSVQADGRIAIAEFQLFE